MTWEIEEFKELCILFVAGIDGSSGESSGQPVDRVDGECLDRAMAGAVS